MPGQRRSPASEERNRARKENINREYRDVVEKVASTRRKAVWPSKGFLRIPGPECYSSHARSLTESPLFRGSVLAMIVANALFIGVSTHVSMYLTLEHFDETHGAGTDVTQLVPLWMATCDYSFTVFFLIELVLRMLALGRDFFAATDVAWNIFDSILVVTSVVDFVLTTVFLDLSFVRVLRVLRLTRALRMVRLVRAARFFRTLRLMLLAIVSSSMPLMWASVCVMGIIFVFGVVFQQGALEHISTATMDDTSVDRLRTWFSSMPRTLLTLFMCVTGGLNWCEVVNPLIEAHVVYGVLFVFFVSVMVLAALNIITGIFVNDALELTKADHDFLMQSRVEQNSNNLIQLQNLFRKIDADNSDTVTISELEAGLRRDSVRVALSKVGVEVPDATAFFTLLDTDGGGALEIDEFVMGCLRLRGSGNAVTTESALQRLEVMMRTSMNAQSDIKRRLKKIEVHVSTRST